MASWLYLTIGIIASLVILGTIAIDSSIKQNTDSNIAQVLTDEERVIIRAAISAAESNQDVNKIIGDSYVDSVKYHKVNDSMGQVIMMVKDFWTVEPIDSNFTNGYKQSLKENTLTVEVHRVTNEVLSVKAKPHIADAVTIEFNEEQKRAIAISLADQRLKDLLAGKEYYIVQVRVGGVGINDHCPEMECVLVGFDLVSAPRGVLMATILNPRTGEVLDVTAGEGWR